jgi:hypothetical protein
MQYWVTGSQYAVVGLPGVPRGLFSITVTMKAWPLGDSSCGSCGTRCKEGKRSKIKHPTAEQGGDVCKEGRSGAIGGYKEMQLVQSLLRYF